MDSAVGIDVGVEQFFIFSTSEVFGNPKFSGSTEEIILSRRTKGGANWHKQRINVIKQYVTEL
ncbi:TPA: hypothetical protein ACSPJ7_005547 [Bacillus cereus]